MELLSMYRVPSRSNTDIVDDRQRYRTRVLITKMTIYCLDFNCVEYNSCQLSRMLCRLLGGLEYFPQSVFLKRNACIQGVLERKDATRHDREQDGPGELTSTLRLGFAEKSPECLFISIWPLWQALRLGHFLSRTDSLKGVKPRVKAAPKMPQSSS